MSTEKYIPLHVLEKITNEFSAHLRIGTGGYGDVYKAVYNGREVAVKLLHVDTVQGIDDQQYINEVGNLLRVNHPNIIQLLGYSYETKSELVQHNSKRRLSQHIYRALCFEFFQGGSLDVRLREESFAPDWSTRYMIIKGICEGLDFLHRCEPPIFHLDLKPANILLDSSMVPKVADFGLSRLFGGSHTHVTQQIKGTQAYMPPEFINGGNISHKNDVFSLGVVMVEIMTGSPGHSSYIEMDEVAQFKQKVHTDWKNRIKATSEYPSEESHQVQTCIDTAVRCVEPDRNSRPTIVEVLDILNKTETHIPKRQLADVFPCPIINHSNTMANTLKEMAAELDNITNQNRYSSFMPDNSSNIQQVTDLRETISDVEEELVIGRTEDTQEIVATLCGSITSENNITVLPIYGIGGIGKTTVAQLVFNDSRFAGYSRVWIYVSQHFDLNKIGNSIISQLSEESHVTNKQIITKKLRELFSSKKVLIVLDDVWETNPRTLKDLKVMLRPGVGSMVTVIVTTRDEAIAREICHTVEPYKLETLTDKLCWEIIKQQTSFKDRADKQQLKRVGREIAAKCGGMALAAQSIGYTLKGKTSDEWESVRDNYIWNLSTSEDPSSIDHEVLASLLLSYSRMPYWLKLCFSYWAVFPKGHNVAKHDLIQQWIALGLTEPSRIFDTMQLCEKYLTQLLGMSFLQYSMTTSGDRERDKYVTLFRMHDLVHDLAKEIFSHQINTCGNRCRYALIRDCSSSLQLSVAFPANIRALHFWDCHNIVLCGGALSPAKGLRILDLSECFIRKLPDCIGQLKQLRFLHAPQIQDEMIPNCITELSELNYLNLSNSSISSLPESIGNMKGLMHLDLSGCGGIWELPVSFAELKQLVHLDLSGCHGPISEALGGFTKLQYLNLTDYLEPTNTNRGGPLEFIGNLTKLRYLNLSGCINPIIVQSEDQIGSLFGSISTLYNLEHLDLSQNEVLSSIPESIGNLRKLHILDLSYCRNLKKLPECMIQMVNLKVLNVARLNLDESVLSWSKLKFASLPDFVVHASSDKCSSNIILLRHTNPEELNIDRLENVKSAEEARSIKLMVKRKIEKLRFEWTSAAERFVDDKDVLEKLVPPSSVHYFSIKGYMSVSFPDWLMDISWHLPNLQKLYFFDFPKCTELPSLGELPNLQELDLYRMERLEKWNTEYTNWDEGTNELRFRRLHKLTIDRCPKLRIKPCLPRAILDLEIIDSDNVLSSCRESSSHRGATTTHLRVGDSKVPMHQWRLLHHLPALRKLSIADCSDLTTSSEIIQHLSSLRSLSLSRYKLESMASPPQWLGELTSLRELNIRQCKGIGSFPDSIQQLANLGYLSISSCPALEKWCESKENFMKLVHIRGVRVALPSTSADIPLKYLEAMIIEETTDLTTIKDTVTDVVHLDPLYTAVMNMPGFVEEALLVALSHLMDNDAQASAYMVMEEEDRVSWLRNFLAMHY
ncbi:unnamed protein product [Triticum turgidum subsp. durum]|uniref:Protein kinase domain-containing protein n=1 Tax=Triticum turgidum subsp. durum TaxID=4567 RepID=A0A9R1AFP8_TRITD|nr:unnamed protein product [Triticum turgidum subsp. durum]